MAAVTTKKNSELTKASQYFVKLAAELNLDKYASAKNKPLFELTSFQNMHDADLAYNYVYLKCAENAQSKESLLRCLENEQRTIIKDPVTFNSGTYIQNAFIVIKGIERQLNSGLLDYLF